MSKPKSRWQMLAPNTLSPPVCRYFNTIFAKSFVGVSQDVDDIHEYLLLKGVDAVSIHGGKEQEERNEAIKLFKVCICSVRLFKFDVFGLCFGDGCPSAFLHVNWLWRHGSSPREKSKNTICVRRTLMFCDPKGGMLF